MAGETQQHSKLGISGCIVAFCVWIYFPLAGYLFFFVDGFSARLSELFMPESRGIADMRGVAAAIVLLFFLLLVIPAAGHFLGLALSVAGVFAKTRRKLFPLTGIVLNLLPLATLTVIFAIGYLVPA